MSETVYHCDQCGKVYAAAGTCSNQHEAAELVPVEVDDNTAKLVQSGETDTIAAAAEPEPAVAAGGTDAPAAPIDEQAGASTVVGDAVRSALDDLGAAVSKLRSTLGI